MKKLFILIFILPFAFADILFKDFHIRLDDIHWEMRGKTGKQLGDELFFSQAFVSYYKEKTPLNLELSEGKYLLNQKVVTGKRKNYNKK